MAALLQQALQSDGWQQASPVGTAVLEFGAIPLAEQICDFASRIAAQGCYRLWILPLFLLPGVHVQVDLPAALAQARPSLPPGLEVGLLNYLGSHPALPQFLDQQRRGYAVSAWVVLAHGSRRPQANQPVEQIAERLGAEVAYWSVPPSLPEVIQRLAMDGHQHLGILPYFLFTGSTADEIYHQLVQIQLQFPQTTLHLAPFLQPTPELAGMMLDLCLGSRPAPITP